MQNKLEVFQIKLKPHEEFRLYVADDNHIYSTTNIKHPYIDPPRDVWDPVTKTFQKIPQPPYRTRWALPTFSAHKKDLNYVLETNMMAMVKSCYNLSSTPSEDIRPFTAVIALKYYENDLVEIGMAILSILAQADHHNIKIEKLVNRYLKLKAFW
jgi:hypothetical protein